MSTLTKQRGRPRDEAASAAVLEALRELLAEGGPAAVSVEAVARKAGVGKQTVYRRWDGLGVMALDALVHDARESIVAPDTGLLEGDLTAFLTGTFRLINDRDAGLLRFLAAEAQRDEEFAATFRDVLVMGRREELAMILARECRDARTRELVLDMVYGAMWYRLLVGHAPLNDEFAALLARAAVSVLQSLGR